MKYQIPVTLEHLEIARANERQGGYSACAECLVAVAVKDFFSRNPLPFPELTRISVGRRFVCFEDPRKYHSSLRNSELCRLTLAFDACRDSELHQMLPTVLEIEFT